MRREKVRNERERMVESVRIRAIDNERKIEGRKESAQYANKY